MSEARDNIEALRTADKVIELDENQFFCETPKTYEIWHDEPLVRIKVIRKSSVLWVHEK